MSLGKTHSDSQIAPHLPLEASSSPAGAAECAQLAGIQFPLPPAKPGQNRLEIHTVLPYK